MGVTTFQIHNARMTMDKEMGGLALQISGTSEQQTPVNFVMPITEANKMLTQHNIDDPNHLFGRIGKLSWPGNDKNQTQFDGLISYGILPTEPEAVQEAPTPPPAPAPAPVAAAPVVGNKGAKIRIGK